MNLRKSLARLPSGGVTQRVFGEPIESPDGGLVIPVVRVTGVRGGAPSPVGVFVIHGGKAQWEPAVDANRLALLGAVIGLASAVISTLAVLRRPPWPDLSVEGLAQLAKRPKG
ncbi:hypothetical protein [Amycolatopsis saalfeldensis]|uniref:Sporulation protein YtfJ (Spore_YtfJ) n=1 Tax=Amycolatopsis saalfeldensis TaxID=394193 RepID=A0A1H8YHG1_9PSEU|nr:hypothetical protein [Amycolatopsis saalfeldensis]SEP51503.1 hypothetical protein SAMN04489732_11675 [Amycolatopsis saalfeldensis]